MRGFLGRLFAPKPQPVDVNDPRLSQLPEAADPPLFVYVRLPGNIMPIERGARYEDPLEVQLRGAGLGAVTGGGSLLSAPDQKGRRRIDYCGIDVDLTRPRDGIVLLLSELRRLRAPVGTTLEFEVGGMNHQLDVYEST